MKNLFSLFSMFLSFLLIGQNNDSSALENYPLEKSLLWKIEGNGLEAPSYLFGTMHMVCDENYDVGDAVKNALQNTEQIYLEIDMDNVNNMEIAQLAISEEGTLKENLSDEDYAYLNSALAEKNLPISQLETMHPAFIYAMFIQLQMNCAGVSVENEIIQLKDDKEINGLEDITYQLELIKSLITYDNLVEILKLNSTEGFTKLMNAYIDNDLPKISEITLAMDAEGTNVLNDLLITRNENWIAQMPGIMEKMPTFFAVGAAHLVSNKGLINLLREKGYTLTPIY